LSLTLALNQYQRKPAVALKKDNREHIPDDERLLVKESGDL